MRRQQRGRMTRVAAPPPGIPGTSVPRAVRREGRAPEWVQYTQYLSGVYRVKGVAQYELYVGVDANPDFTAAPAQTEATLPFSYTTVPPGAGTKEYRPCVRYRNSYGVLSLNQYTRSFVIDNTGALVTPDPSGPEDVVLIEAHDLYLRVTAVYRLRNDDGDNAADYWDIYAKVGSAPVPGVDSPTAVAMTSGSGPVSLNYRLGPYSHDDVVYIIVRCRRNADSATDGNTTQYTHTMESRPDSPEKVQAF